MDITGNCSGQGMMNGRRGPTWQDIAQGVIGLLMALMLWWQSDINAEVKDLAKHMVQLQERTVNMDKEILQISTKLDSFARRETVKDLSERVNRLHNQ